LVIRATFVLDLAPKKAAALDREEADGGIREDGEARGGNQRVAKEVTT
jgi:hypothetical protein